MLYSNDPITTTWALLTHTTDQESWFRIAQGLTEDDRIGRRICVRNVMIKGHLSLATGETAATGQNLVRLALVMDSQANGSNGSTGDVWETSVAGIHTYRNLANQARYTILWDKVFAFNTSLAGNGTALDTADGVIPFSFHKRVEFIVQYNAGAGALAEIESANVYLMGVTSNSNGVTIDARARVRYTD